MPLDLIDRNLVVVMGKGGVGKSSVSAAMAIAASERGRRTLVCELDAKGDLSRLLGISPVGYEGVEVRPGLVAMSMDSERSLAEYLRVQAHIPFVGRIRPLARVFDFVASAAPGVREVLSIGKLAWEAREPGFDLVIADATATGHAIGQLAAPAAIRELFRLGMVRTQLDWMVDLLENPEMCTAVAVTTPEEMPVIETIELVSQTRGRAQIDVSAVIVNRVRPTPFTVAERAVFDRIAAIEDSSGFERPAGSSLGSAIRATSFALRRRELGAAHLRHLREGLPDGMPLMLIPELFACAETNEGVDHLSRALADEAGW